MIVDELLAAARARLDRADPAAAQAAMDDGALMVDIRAESQRARDGVVPGSMFIPREHARVARRADERGAKRDRDVRRGLPSQALAAATLRDLGLEATDLIGGFQAWVAAGLPVER